MFLAVVLYLIVLGAFLWLLVYLENSAAFRGSKGDPLPDYVDKSLRAGFFIFMVAPLAYSFPLSILPLGLYMYTYLDQGERYGRPSGLVRGLFIFDWFKKYFALKLITTVPIDPTKQYIFAIQPHGILPLGGVINFISNVNEVSQKIPVPIRGLAATACFYMPIYRDVLLGGGVVDASRYNARRVIEGGLSLWLVPGGSREALYSTPKSDTLVLKCRKGFVKLAIEHGVPIVPVFSFGETDTYDQWIPDSGIVWTIKDHFQKITGLSLPLLTHLIPHPAEIATVVGTPMAVRKNPNPSDEEVQRVLDQYIEHLRAFHAKYAHVYNKKDKPLIII